MIDHVAPDVVEHLPAPRAAEGEPGVRVVPDPDPGTFRIVMDGEIDVAVRPELQRVCAEAALAGLATEVDARSVTFMDSTGIAFLARLSTTCPGRPVLHASPVVRWLVDVSGLGDLLDVVGDPSVDPTPELP